MGLFFHLYILAKILPFAGRKYSNFNVIKYNIKLETLTKIKKNAYKNITLIFILF